MAALAEVQINQVMLLLGVGLLVFVLFNRIRRGWKPAGRPARLSGSWRSGHESAAPATRTREVIGSARLRSADASLDQESWEVDMHRLARQLKGEIDTKMRALAQSIKVADEARIALDRSIERAQSVDVSGKNNPLVISQERRPSVTGQFAHAPRRRSHAQALRETVSGSQDCSADPGDDPRFQRVYALADAGFSAAKIAGQIGSQVGEVELILSLRDQNKVDAA